jgi:hypothetical protein
MRSGNTWSGKTDHLDNLIIIFGKHRHGKPEVLADDRDSAPVVVTLGFTDSNSFNVVQIHALEMLTHNDSSVAVQLVPGHHLFLAGGHAAPANPSHDSNF